MLPFHYAWVVVIAGSIVSSINATFLYAFGIFLVPISEATGWSRGQVSLAYSFGFIAMGLFAISVGWLSDRFGTRKVLIVGTIVFIVSIVEAGRVSSLWQFYLFYGVLAGGARSVFTTTLPTTVGLWFRKKLGVAIGILMAATGGGPFILAPLIRYLITLVGWQDALMVLGGVGGGLMLLFAPLIRNRPSDLGLRAYGEQPEPVSAGEGNKVHHGIFYTGEEKDFFKHARKTRPFVPLILIHFLGCVSHSVPLAHGAAMATDMGIPAIVAASVLGVVSGASIASRFGISVLADLLGGKKALFLTLSIQASSILLLLVAHEAWQFFLFAVVFGIGYGGEMVVFPIINRQYYGGAPIGTIYGYQMLGAGLGMALGGYLGGLLFDMMSGYVGAIWVASLVGYMSLVVILRLPAAKQKQAARA